MSELIANLLTIFVVIIPLFCTSPSIAKSDKISIIKAQQFLAGKVANNQISLSCLANTKTPCPVNQSGELLSSYFISNALYPAISDRTKQQLITLIENQNRAGLWGYSQNSPVDSDDTSFALQSLILLNHAESYSPIFKFYRNQYHLFETFYENKAQTLEKLPSEQHNHAFHPEVNSNIDNLLLMSHAKYSIPLKAIESSQAKDGSWPSYFYPSPYYNTFLSLKILCNTNTLPDSKIRALDYIIKTQHANGSWGNPANILDTTLALNSLKVCHQFNKSYQNGMKYLAKTQLKDGSWPSNKPIWQYVLRDFPFIIWTAHDDNRIISTSLALMAVQ